MVDGHAYYAKIKILLTRMKRFALEVAKTGGHTEQGLCLFIIFVIDVATLGISCLEGRQQTLEGKIDKKRESKRKQKSERINRGTAISYDVAAFIRSFYVQFPVYLLKEERLINEVMYDKILAKRNDNIVNFIGFDCEWVSRDNGVETSTHVNSPVALLQIATPSECILVQVSNLKSIPDMLKNVLENKHILKFGVGIDEDCKRLRMFGIQVCGTVDLRYLIQRCHHKSDIIQFPERLYGLSLSSLSDAIVGVQMDKSYRVRCSNWESKEHSQRQIAYAANDAIVALQIFLALSSGKVNSKKIIPLHQCIQKLDKKSTNDQLLLMSFLFGKTYLFNQRKLAVEAKEDSIWKNYARSITVNDEVTKVGFSLCQGIIDLSFKNKSKTFNKKTSSDKNLTKISSPSIPSRKTPLYHNCLLTAPDGCLLCTCDRKKAEWYVNKDLGTVVNSEPFTVQLNYDPSGRPFVDRDYYMTFKDNKCVVCGKEEDYVKKMVVPRDYRRHFPASLKDHISHDVLLLCVSCHQTSQLHDLRLRREIAEKYSVPLNNSRLSEDGRLKRVRSAAKALVHGGDQIPKQRQKDLKSVLKEFIDEDEIDLEKLKALSEITTTRANDSYSGSHGEHVVEKLVDTGTLREFVKMWRKHFLSTMKPKFLPEYWSVDHNLTYQTEA